MKEISIFHQYFGTIDSFIYKAYYIDFYPKTQNQGQ